MSSMVDLDDDIYGDLVSGGDDEDKEEEEPEEDKDSDESSD